MRKSTFWHFATLLLAVLAGLLVFAVSGCAVQPPHLAQAPRPARHQYRHAQRHNARVRPHLQPFYLPWN